MRLWSYEILEFLPKSQLIAQWRECNLLVKDDNEGRKTNHILINYVWEYDISHLYCYMDLVKAEMHKRGLLTPTDRRTKTYFLVDKKNLFCKHHDNKYLVQCFYNLQEKYDRGQKDFDRETYLRLENFMRENWLYR